jgi:hypothetical protein
MDNPQPSPSEKGAVQRLNVGGLLNPEEFNSLRYSPSFMET